MQIKKCISFVQSEKVRKQKLFRRIYSFLTLLILLFSPVFDTIAGSSWLAKVIAATLTVPANQTNLTGFTTTTQVDLSSANTINIGFLNSDPAYLQQVANTGDVTTNVQTSTQCAYPSGSNYVVGIYIQNVILYNGKSQAITTSNYTQYISSIVYNGLTPLLPALSPDGSSVLAGSKLNSNPAFPTLVAGTGTNGSTQVSAGQLTSYASTSVNGTAISNIKIGGNTGYTNTADWLADNTNKGQYGCFFDPNNEQALFVWVNEGDIGVSNPASAQAAYNAINNNTWTGNGATATSFEQTGYAAAAAYALANLTIKTNNNNTSNNANNVMGIESLGTSFGSGQNPVAPATAVSNPFTLSFNSKFLDNGQAWDEQNLGLFNYTFEPQSTVTIHYVDTSGNALQTPTVLTGNPQGEVEGSPASKKDYGTISDTPPSSITAANGAYYALDMTKFPSTVNGRNENSAYAGTNGSGSYQSAGMDGNTPYLYDFGNLGTATTISVSLDATTGAFSGLHYPPAWGNFDIYYIYDAITIPVTVNYIDDDWAIDGRHYGQIATGARDGQPVSSSSVNSGILTVNLINTNNPTYSIAQQIADYENQGYQLVSDSSVGVTDLFANPSGDTYNIHFVHTFTSSLSYSTSTINYLRSGDNAVVAPQSISYISWDNVYDNVTGLTSYYYAYGKLTTAPIVNAQGQVLDASWTSITTLSTVENSLDGIWGWNINWSALPGNISVGGTVTANVTSQGANIPIGTLPNFQAVQNPTIYQSAKSSEQTTTNSADAQLDVTNQPVIAYTWSGTTLASSYYFCGNAWAFSDETISGMAFQSEWYATAGNTLSYINNYYNVGNPETYNNYTFNVYYTPVLEPEVATQTLTRKINYLSALNVNLQLAPSVTQTVTYNSVRLVNLATGATVGYDLNGDNQVDTTNVQDSWFPVSSTLSQSDGTSVAASSLTSIDAVTSPDIAGFDSPSIAVVQSGKVTVDFSTANQTVGINGAANAQGTSSQIDTTNGTMLLTNADGSLVFANSEINVYYAPISPFVLPVTGSRISLILLLVAGGSALSLLIIQLVRKQAK